MKAHHSLKTEREAVRQLEAFLGQVITWLEALGFQDEAESVTEL